MKATTSDRPPPEDVVAFYVGDRYAGHIVAPVDRRKAACVYAGVGLALAMSVANTLMLWHTLDKVGDLAERVSTDNHEER